MFVVSPVKDVNQLFLQKFFAVVTTKFLESGATLLGGHTVKDQELKYGLSVTGVVHPDRVLRNSSCKPGDKLVITKRIGTGVIITGAKNDLLTPEEFQPALENMRKTEQNCM